MICKNCEHAFEGGFCNNCGQNSKVERINVKNFLNELTESVFQVNKGFFYTFKELFIRPGDSIREFINGKRKKHFKPIAYALVFSTLYFLLSQVIGENTWMYEFISGSSDVTNNSAKGMEMPPIIVWFSKNFAYATLVLLPIFSLASFIVFFRAGLNYLEHIVLNSYITGQQAIFYSFLLLIDVSVKDAHYLEIIPFVVSVLYALWVFSKFFTKGNQVIVIFRVILVYTFYLLLCSGLILLLFKVHNF